MNNHIRLKEHLINLLNALTNLSPSRNLITQLILLLPRDLATIEYSYPELSRPKAKEVLHILGVEFNEQVTRTANSFAEALYKHIHRFFDWLDNETIRADLARITDLPINTISNPYLEWARKVLSKFARMSNGDKILKFLKMLIERDSFLVERHGYSRGAYKPDWQPFLDEVRKRLKINSAELEEILKLTVRIPGASEPIKHTIGSHGFNTTEYLEHSEYHLDLIVSKESWNQLTDHYNRLYIVKHRKTIKDLLEELKHE